jgi:hypothetical protein
VIKSGSTTLYTLTATNAAYFYDSGALSVTIPASTVVTLSETPGSGCSGGGSGYNLNLNYQ